MSLPNTVTPNPWLHLFLPVDETVWMAAVEVAGFTEAAAAVLKT